MSLRYILVILFCLFINTTVVAETYIREYTYKASEADSKLTSRTIALDQVKTILLQEIGTHIRQEINITKDGDGNTYASDDVEAITAGLTKVEIVEEKWNGETYYLKAKVEADASRVLNALEEFKKEKSEENIQQLETLKENELELNAARDEVARLRGQLSNVMSESKHKDLVDEYNQQVDKISVNEMYKKGYNYYEKGQYGDAFYWYKKAAEKGHAGGQDRLAFLYAYGYGVKQDYEQTIYWNRKSAEQGGSAGQAGLGANYANGYGVKQSFEKALPWYRKAAEQGNAAGQAGMAGIYASGHGVEQNFELAFFLYTLASKQGHADSQNALGFMYEEGLGVEQDDELSEKWYEMACDGGNKMACTKI